MIRVVLWYASATSSRTSSSMSSAVASLYGFSMTTSPCRGKSNDTWPTFSLIPNCTTWWTSREERWITRISQACELMELRTFTQYFSPIWRYKLHLSLKSSCCTVDKEMETEEHKKKQWNKPLFSVVLEWSKPRSLWVVQVCVPEHRRTVWPSSGHPELLLWSCWRRPAQPHGPPASCTSCRTAAPGCTDTALWAGTEHIPDPSPAGWWTPSGAKNTDKYSWISIWSAQVGPYPLKEIVRCKHFLVIETPDVSKGVHARRSRCSVSWLPSAVGQRAAGTSPQWRDQPHDTPQSSSLWAAVPESSSPDLKPPWQGECGVNNVEEVFNLNTDRRWLFQWPVPSVCCWQTGSGVWQRSEQPHYRHLRYQLLFHPEEKHLLKIGSLYQAHSSNWAADNSVNKTQACKRTSKSRCDRSHLPGESVFVEIGIQFDWPQVDFKDGCSTFDVWRTWEEKVQSHHESSHTWGGTEGA